VLVRALILIANVLMLSATVSNGKISSNPAQTLTFLVFAHRNEIKPNAPKSILVKTISMRALLQAPKQSALMRP